MVEERPHTPTARPLFSDDLLDRFRGFIAEHLGLHFPPERRRDLATAGCAVARELGFTDAGEWLRNLVAAPPGKEEIALLARHLTVGETYFFRDPNSFAVLEERILPEIIAARRRGDRRLRLWSAGCATGEEPYSLAILLSRMLIAPPEWNITILATDVNSQALRKASDGIFGSWSFRDAPPWLKPGYFQERPDGRFEIHSRIREMVSFAPLNLTEDSYPSLTTNTNAMDLILCRNVLMYLVPQASTQVVERFHHALRDHGWLMVSAAELALAQRPGLATIHWPGAILLQKGEQPAKGGTFPFSPEPPPPAAPGPVPVSRPVPAAPSPALPPPLPTAAPLAGASELYARGRYQEAATDLAARLAQHPDDAAALALLARSCANLGDFAAAARWCRQAIAAAKFDAGLRYLEALILEEQGDFDEAAEALRRALYLNPGFILAHYALGHLRRRQGKPEQAEKHLRQALNLLKACPPETLLPEAEGMSAARLRESVATLLGRPEAAGAIPNPPANDEWPRQGRKPSP